MMDNCEERTPFADMSVREFFEKVSSDSPTPGGGTASATAGAAGISLVMMVAALTEGKKKYRDAQEDVSMVLEEGDLLRSELMDLADEDSEAFDAVMAALRLPRTSEQEKRARTRSIQAATRQAAEVPRQVMVRCHRVLELAVLMARVGNANAVSDALVGGELAASGVRGAAANVQINLGSLSDEEYCEELIQQMEKVNYEVERQLEDLRNTAAGRM